MTDDSDSIAAKLRAKLVPQKSDDLTLSQLEDANEQARHDRIVKLENALRDALDLVARALEEADEFVPEKNEAYNVAVAKLAELQKVLDEK